MPVAPLTSLLVRAKLPFLVLQGPCRTGIPSFCRRSALGLKGVAFGCHQHHVVGCRCTCALKGHSLPRHRRLPCPDLLALCADKTVCVCVCVCVYVCACVRACVHRGLPLPDRLALLDQLSVNLDLFCCMPNLECTRIEMYSPQA